MNLQINDLILTSIELFLNINMKKNKDFQSNNTNSYDKSSNEMIGHDAQLFQKPIQVKQPQNQDRFPNIFRFADTKDVILMIFGTIGSVLVGVFFVISFLFQGNMINNFQLPTNQLIENMVIRFYYFLGTGTIQLIGGFLMYFGWIIAGYRQAQKCRAQYLSAIFRQQIGWFETQDQSKIFTQFASDCDTFQQAINQKMAVCLFLLSSFAARIIVTLIVVWQLSLVLIGLIIVIVIVFTVTALIDQKYTQEVQKKSIDATARSEQALSCIQTVKALNGQQFQSCKYDKFLQMVQQNQFKLRLSNGVSSGIMFFVIYCLFSLGNFYGLHLISVQATSTYSATGFISIGDIFVVIFVLGIGVFITLQFKATLKKITDGIRAFNRIKSVIDRKKLQNQPQGIVPNAFYGHFLLENVSFCYPSQPEHKVLDNLTIDFNKQKHALVGFSGSGKSTIFQLLIRLYEPSSGKIYLDGVDIKQINVKWLRKNIGYVTQQSFFFTGTLRQNMLVSNPTASDSQIYDALKAAEIFETVQALQEKLDTKIFSNANQFSGGQRQRLSIAKALLRKPKILLLDEPTSSLDRKTETQIQKNLDQITVQMKSISIAHRISTIKNSDKIIFMKNGRVVQQGKLQQLVQFNAQVCKIKNNLVLHRNSSIFQQLKQFQNNSPQISLELSRRFSEEPVLSQIMIQQQYQQETIKQQNQGNQENQDKRQGQQKKLQKQYSGSVYFRIFRLSNKKFPFLIIAFILCIPIGMAPSFVGRQMGILITAGIELQGEALRQVSNYSSLIIFVIGTSFFIVKFFQSFLFSLCGSEITVQLRKRVFKKILNMPVCWFAEKDNSVTNLTQFLDKDCQQIQNLVTVSLGIMIQVLVVSLTSLTISFIYEYRVSFVVLAIIPPTVLINLLQIKINGSLAKQVEDIDKDSNSLLRQSMVNAKIILSNCFEDLVIRKYKQNIYAPLNSIIKKGIYSGLLYGISVFILIVVVGTQYIVMAAVLIQDPNIQIVNVIVPIFAMNICFIFITYLFHFMPDIGLAKRSAIKAFTILDLQDQQQMQRRQNSKMMQLNPQQFQQISLNNVTFRYPNRKQNVLEKASLTIFKGNQYNVIGRSGCGKSTLFKLLLRFYEPSEDSEIKINGVNIKQYDIKSLRNHFGLVSQQPMLFSGTIRQNITYNTKQKELKDIQQAAILSNALEFIKGQNMNSKHLSGKVLMVYGKNALKKDEEQVNQGYEKQVGVKGNQLSGGQRQRIAIARVMLRNPDFFLFDESTSALDHQTQSIVQSNFKQILKGKTSLNITHNFKQHQGKSIILIEDKNFGVINPIKKRE